MKKLYIECECRTPEHKVVFTHDPQDEIPELRIETHLNNLLPLYKRIFVAIEYVMGTQIKYGAFNETVLDLRQIKQLKTMCENIQCNYAGK